MSLLSDWNDERIAHDAGEFGPSGHARLRTNGSEFAQPLPRACTDRQPVARQTAIATIAAVFRCGTGIRGESCRRVRCFDRQPSAIITAIGAHHRAAAFDSTLLFPHLTSRIAWYVIATCNAQQVLFIVVWRFHVIVFCWARQAAQIGSQILS